MTDSDLHNLVLNYGRRGYTIKTLADELDISEKEARFLTQALGYHHTKRTTYVTFEAFFADNDVRLILNKINSSGNSKTSH